MENIIRLANCGNYIAQKIKTNDHLICLNRILTVGSYTDMSGKPVEVTEEVLVKLVTNYNKRLEEEFIKYQLSIEENSDVLAPAIVTDAKALTIDCFDGLVNQVDHNIKTVRDTVGNLYGKMYLKKSQVSPGVHKLGIFCDIKVKGYDNVCCVADNRWRNLSAAFNTDNHTWAEVSWVVYGADPDANKIMSANFNNNLQNNSHGENNYDTMERCINLIKDLQREVFLEKRLILMCKLKKITKADTYFIKKELAKVKELSALNVVFNVLDDMVIKPESCKFIPLEKEEARQLGITMQAGANNDIY